MFYDVLKQLCDEKNISISAVCETIGITSANPTYWKQGKSPNLKALQKIADYFDVSTDYLLERTHTAHTTPPSTQTMPEGLRVFLQQKLGRELTQEEVNRIFNFTFVGDEYQAVIERLEKLSPENRAIAYDFLALLLKNQGNK